MNVGNKKPIVKKSAYKPSKKRLYSKLNCPIYTNGFDRLAEEKIMTFVPRPYQLVPWRGVDRKKIEISDSILIEIGAENCNNNAVLNEFLVVKNGAAKNRSNLAAEKSDTVTEFYSFERYSELIEKVDLMEEKKSLTIRPTEDKSVTTEDITVSFPEIKHLSIEEIMSTKRLEKTKSESSYFNCLKLDKRYRVPVVQVKKIQDTCPLTDTKRLIHVTNFVDYNQRQFYEEYEVNDCFCDTQDLTKYFNFNNYSFEDLLSGKIRITQLENNQRDPINLIDIQIKGSNGCVYNPTDKINTNLIKETQKKVYVPLDERECVTKTGIRSLSAVVKLQKKSKKTICLDDLIRSMDKQIKSVSQMAEATRKQFDNFKNERLFDKTNDWCQYSNVRCHSWCDQKLDRHIDKYYNTSKLKNPLICRTVRTRPERTSFNNLFRSNSYSETRPTILDDREVPIFMETSEIFTFSEKTHDLVERKIYTNEY